MSYAYYELPSPPWGPRIHFGPAMGVGAPDPDVPPWVVTGFWFFVAAAVVGGAIMWAYKGPAAGAATAWFISPIPPPPLSPI